MEKTLEFIETLQSSKSVSVNSTAHINFKKKDI